MCSEAGWKLEEAVEHLRGITALACGNPYLIEAVAKFLNVDADVPLNPAGDQGHWICISPPGTPTATQAPVVDLAEVAAKAEAQLAGTVQTEEEAAGEELSDLFAGI